MVKATYWGGVGVGLTLLLAACSGVAVETPVGSAAVRGAPTAEPTVVEPAAVTAAETPPATTAAIVEPAFADEAGADGMIAVEQEEANKMADSPEMVTAVAEPVVAEVTDVAPEQPGPTEAQRQLLANLTVKGTPPELQNEVWLNSAPLKLADLRGKVAIVEFWTFG